MDEELQRKNFEKLLRDMIKTRIKSDFYYLLYLSNPKNIQDDKIQIYKRKEVEEIPDIEGKKALQLNIFLEGLLESYLIDKEFHNEILNELKYIIGLLSENEEQRDNVLSSILGSLKIFADKLLIKYI